MLFYAKKVYGYKERRDIMDQMKIGKYIAECRKQKHLTQCELVSALGITDKAVSKWERGVALPDPSLMMELCEHLGISVNELFIGETITTDNHQEKNEALLLTIARDLKHKDHLIWTSMWILMTVCIVAYFGGVLMVAWLIPEGIWMAVALITLTILFLLPCFYAVKLEVSVGVYKCKQCGHEIVPTYREALWAMHKGTTRYLKCPSCHKRTWCKKVLK